MKEILCNQKYNKGIAKNYSKYFNITKGKNGPNKVEEKNDVIQEEINFCVFFMALSNKKLTPKEMLERLRKRDKAEKTFSQMKSFLDGEKSYCHGTNTYVGKNFITFFALVMKLSFRYFKKPYFDNEKYKSNDTTATVLGYASKLIAYKTKNGWNRKYAFTSKIKQIFKNLDYDETKIDQFLATELSKSVQI